MRDGFRRALAVAVLSLVVQAAGAQSYPTRSVRIVVPFGPGGFTDVVARILGQRLTTALGQAFIIENKPGAGSSIGTDSVAKSPADGYTLLIVSTTHVISPWLYKNLPYDPVKSFTAVSKLVESPYVLVVNNLVAAKGVKDFVALSKSQPGKMHFASSGNGSSQHLIGGLFNSMTGAGLTHVPYRSSSLASQDVLAGVVESTFAGVPNALTAIQSGRAHALAVTSAQRIPQLPAVPTMQEAGVAGYDASIWLALLAPAGTPREIVARLNTEIAKVMLSVEAKKAFYDNGVQVSLSTPEAMNELMIAERERWGKVVKAAGIEVD
jgi:tripartite-type tricarboxylate transporter receptor subunit TctC